MSLQNAGANGTVTPDREKERNIERHTEIIFTPFGFKRRREINGDKNRLDQDQAEERGEDINHFDQDLTRVRLMEIKPFVLWLGKREIFGYINYLDFDQDKAGQE